MCTGMWTQLPSLNTPSWPNAIVIIQSVFHTLPACLALHVTEPQHHFHELPQSTTKHGSAGTSGCYAAQPPAQSRSITNARADQQVQLLSHSPGGFYAKTGIKTIAIFKLQPCLNWWPLHLSLYSGQKLPCEEYSGERRSPATQKLVLLHQAWQHYECLQTVKMTRFQFEVGRKANYIL